MEKKEYKHIDVDHKETAKQWIKDGWAVVGEKVKLNTLDKGEFFLKDGLICFINVTSKEYISFYDNILREYSTSNVEQLVYKITLKGVK